MSYLIKRMYYPKHNRPSEVIHTGLSLEDAQSHCNDPKTRKAGEWFDCYTEE